MGKVLVVVAVGLLIAAEAKKGKKEADRLVGTWTMVSAETGGEKEADDKFKDATMTFTAGGKATLKLPDQDIEFTYELDPAKKPAHITLTSEGRTFRGIYKIEGNKLTVCVSEPNSDTRPTKFATEAGTMMRLAILKREKK